MNQCQPPVITLTIDSSEEKQAEQNPEFDKFFERHRSILSPLRSLLFLLTLWLSAPIWIATELYILQKSKPFSRSEWMKQEKDYFEGLKKLLREAKEFATDDGVIRMPPAVFENEPQHETTMGKANIAIELDGATFVSGKTIEEFKLHLSEILNALPCTDKIEKLKKEIQNETEVVLLLQLGKEVMEYVLAALLAQTPCPPPSFGGDGHSGTAIDTEIAALVAEMNRVGIHTTCSCQGNEGGEAYIGIRLGEGTTYLYRKDIFGLGQDELVLRWRRK